MIKNTNGLSILKWLGLTIIFTTGFLEYMYAYSGFILWGYIAGVLFTQMSDSRRYTLVAIMLSTGFMLISFSNTSLNDGGWLKGVYVGFGLGSTILYFVFFNSRKPTAYRNKEQLSEIFLHGTEGIVLTKTNGEIIMANPFSKKVLGYVNEDLSGSQIEDLIPGINSLVRQIEKDQSIHQKELVAKRKDGSHFSIEISIKRYEAESLEYFVTFFTDITQRKESEKALLFKKAELEQAIQELEAFTYSVSHDLRAPLRGISGYASMLEEDYYNLLDEEGKRILLGIRESSEQMGQLIDDLLSFSRLGKQELAKAHVDMTERFKTALNDINKGMAHATEIVFQSLHAAQADPRLIIQVATNLLSNAIKYSSKVSNPRIEIGSRENAGEVVYSISDNGAGFNMKYAAKLFGVFQRLHSNQEFEGTGVGLAIVKRIIQKHGGKVWAIGEEGKGATFYFSLPQVHGSKNVKSTRLDSFTEMINA